MAAPVRRYVSFKCVDFVVSDFRDDSFDITMYGIDENRKSYCAKIEDFKPFLYIKVRIIGPTILSRLLLII